jgi:hypothetical protein
VIRKNQCSLRFSAYLRSQKIFFKYFLSVRHIEMEVAGRMAAPN